MENCAATVRVLLQCGRTAPSTSAEDCTAHQDSLLSKSVAFWRASEALVEDEKGMENGCEREDETTD
jgi:hypothetical protein